MSYYSRSTIDVRKIVNIFNKKLEDPTYTQDQKKLICELLVEIFKYDTGYGFYYLYWITTGKAQWIKDGCPEIPSTDFCSQSAKSIFVGEKIGETPYSRYVIVSNKYAENEEYTRRYHA